MKLIKPLLASLTAMVVAAGFALSAQATQISGDIDFAGEVVFDTTSLGTAKQVNTWDMAVVSGTSGDFSSVPLNSTVAFATPYVFNPPTAYTGVNGLWSVGGFTFALTSSTVTMQTNKSLQIFGSGFVSGNGFDQTPGTWSFSVTQSNGHPEQQFSFQGNSAAPAPDSGSTVALLGVGLMAIAAIRARLRS